MATPLTASTVVLMLSVNPNMTFTEIKSVLLSSGVDTEALVAHNATCGGTDGNHCEYEEYKLFVVLSSEIDF